MTIAKFYQKTLFGMFAIMGIIVVAISAIYTYTADRELTGDFVANSKTIARSLANSTVDVIVNQNYSALQTVIDQYVAISGIAYVFVVDADGTIVAHTFVPGIPKEILADYKSDRQVYDRDLKGLGAYTEVTADVLAGEAGRVHIGMDKGYVALRVQTAIGKQVYLLSILFVFSVLISYALMFQVSRPLNQLIAYARHKVAPQEGAAAGSDREEHLLERVDEVGEVARLISALADKPS